jgi:uncharacterized LabA/DUF88 family protein
MSDQEVTRQLRTALFVDFDNIYISLQSRSAQAAERFATQPSLWLSWLEQEINEPYRRLVGGATSRRILVRRCYANPRAFNPFRAAFVRAGFEVVDTPVLTSQGKTSADVHMVIDLLDALAHPTLFDEFLLCSGDADFTPALVRLRKYDRRTAVLAVGPASGALMASADLLFPEQDFLERGLRLDVASAGSENQGLIDAQRDLLARMAVRVRRQAEIVGRIEATDLVPIYREFPEFTTGENWLGFFGLRRLTNAVVAVDDRLRLVEGDTWAVVLVEGAPAASQATSGAGDRVDDAVSRAIHELVDGSETAVPFARLAHHLNARVPTFQTTSWGGAGSLHALLLRLDLHGLEIRPEGGGWIFDPERHTEPSALDDRAARLEKLPSIGRRICAATGLPILDTEGWQALVREIDREISRNGFHPTGTPKAVRDAVNGKGFRISRSEVNLVLTGLPLDGSGQGRGSVTLSSLAEALVSTVSGHAARVQLALSEAELTDLRAWLCGESTKSSPTGKESEGLSS